MQTLMYVAGSIFAVWAFLVFVVVPIGILCEKIAWARDVGRAWYLGNYRSKEL